MTVCFVSPCIPRELNPGTPRAWA